MHTSRDCRLTATILDVFEANGLFFFDVSRA
jgi:hypothetical protein